MLAAILVSAAWPAAGNAPGATTLIPDESVHVRSMSSAVELLEDRAGKLDIATVSQPPASTGFVAATPATANVGFSPSAWWVRLTLRNDGGEPRLVYLRQDYPLIDSLDLYEPLPDFTWRQHATGDRRPFSSRDVAHRDFLFPLTCARRNRTHVLSALCLAGPDRHQPLVARSQRTDRGGKPGTDWRTASTLAAC